MTRKQLDFLDNARKEFKLAQEQERRARDAARDDISFRAGDQWDQNLKRKRENDGRPALTFDKTHVYIQSVANEARQNKPQAKVNAIGGGATSDAANVINGILRHVQYRSQADVAMDTALDYSCGSSFGYIRAITEYTPKSFDQEIRILPVLDPMAVYGVLIPKCLGQEPRFAFVVSKITKAEYETLYGDEETPMDWESAEWRSAGDWLDGENVRIAEYWWITDRKKTLRMVRVGQGMKPIYTTDDDYKDTLDFVVGDDGEPLEREELVPEVKFCKLDGTRILPDTETEWVGDSIPIEPVLGQQLIIDGEVHLFSLIRFIRDAQCLINIYKSAIAEKIALANRVPYIGYKGQFNDPRWEDANVTNYAYLEVDPMMIGDKPAPLPQRQQLEEQIGALSEAVAQEIESLKSGMGIYDASLGAKSNETSGVGIRNRQQQANITNFHFSDNLNRAEWSLCAKLLKVIPKIYDRPGRQVRIVGEDQEHSVVVVNQPYKDEQTGQVKHYPLDVGDYDVVVTVGPSYTTARAEGADTLQEFFQVAPQAVPLLADLYVGSLDYTWSREGARRLKAAAPQQIVNEQDKGQQQIPPQVQAQMQALGQQHEQLVATVHQLQNEIDTKKAELDSRERIAAMQEETKRSLGIAALDQKNGLALLEQEVAALHAKYDRIHEAGMQDAQQQHERQMAQDQQDHQEGLQESQQGHDAEQAQQSQDAAAEQQQVALAQAKKMPKAA